MSSTVLTSEAAISDSLSPELGEIAAAVEILSETRFRIEGRPGQVGQPRPLFAPSYRRDPGAGFSPALARLIAALSDELYGTWYTRAERRPSPPSDPEADARACRDHLRSLSAANRGRGAWEPGWRWRRFAGPDRVEVERYGVVFHCGADLVRLSASPAEPRPGAPCRVRVPAETRGLQPGCWSVLGETDPRDPDEAPGLLRVYWHLLPAAAPRLVHHLTSELNARRLPFRLKLLADPRNYRRADAGVLYLDPRDWKAARPVVGRAYREVKGRLRPEVPRLAAHLGPGLGLSEGRADGASFGTGACVLIARALVAAFAAGEVTPAARRRAVADAFRAAGLDPRHPYRAPGSRAVYRPLAEEEVAPPAPAPTRPASPAAEPQPSRDPEELARRIGDALCASAFRHDGHCNWLGSAPTPEPAGGLAQQALGADLYGGTSGVAVFLAELYRAGGEGEHRRTAIAAQRQAVAALRTEPERWAPLAYYEGQLGVAWAARRVAALTGTEELDRQADELFGSLLPPRPGARRPDLVSGSAGAILALLGLHRETGRSGLLASAVRLGRELVREADPATGRVDRPALTGFGHGAAGIGLALLELGAAAGRSDFFGAADRLFAYEDACFDPRRGGWPDFRSWTPAEPPSAVMVAWCHGATGIALSRLRAIEVDPARARRYRPAARAGLAATAESIERDLDRPGADVGLCHGLSGKAEVLALGAEMLDDPELRATARRAGAALPGLAGSALKSTDPSLFTGAAGIGYTMLRLARPQRVPSMLLPANLSARRKPCQEETLHASHDLHR